ncbi:uncharacterized protein EV420DRAFT_1753717 [Desarmillaria tabescens]|uniref:Uncharacterized protein n=1 Tax=Armillaria tabescens TaxID=1929756 RepID=A0AA39MJI0_ARMTA|nr:uncharacterized protein EV420DRAFT_1753717 [Desarmillaria tabescens]KAK0436637.1 hypothetical protein EV420DRAFT_1753717 [Desarmillaria tabescens]
MGQLILGYTVQHPVSGDVSSDWKGNSFWKRSGFFKFIMGLLGWYPYENIHWDTNIRILRHSDVRNWHQSNTLMLNLIQQNISEKLAVRTSLRQPMSMAMGCTIYNGRVDIPPDLTDEDKALMVQYLDASLNSQILLASLHGIYTGILAVTLWNICEPGASLLSKLT